MSAAPPIPHPAVALQDAVEAMVTVQVERVLQAKGLLRDELTPRGLRIRAGLTLVNAAAKAELSANTLSAIERGQTRDPAPDTTARIAAALGIAAREYREACARLEGKQ